MRVVEYVNSAGRSAYADWFAGSSAEAAAKVAAAVYQLAAGNFSNVKGVGAGVFERKINFGPGYRIYFGRDGATLVVLLGGGTKRRQSRAIATARTNWKAYRPSK